MDRNYFWGTQKENFKRIVVGFINVYDGKRLTTLSTGEKAIDWDDAWLIVQTKDNQPRLRDKRSQRIYEKTHNIEDIADDKFISEIDTDILVEYADELID